MAALILSIAAALLSALNTSFVPIDALAHLCSDPQALEARDIFIEHVFMHGLVPSILVYLALILLALLAAILCSLVLSVAIPALILAFPIGLVGFCILAFSISRWCSSTGRPLPNWLESPHKRKATFLAASHQLGTDIMRADTEATFRCLVRNDGKFTWPAGCRLVFCAGDAMHRPVSSPGTVAAVLQKPKRNEVVRSVVRPGEQFEIAVRLRAPRGPGEYQSFWRLESAQGVVFGRMVGCKIVVRGGRLYPKDAEDSFTQRAKGAQS